jgi:Site-specific recombinase XerD
MKGHVYPRGETFTYVIDLPPHPLTNKRRQKSKGGFATEEKAELAMLEVILKIKQGIYKPDPKMRVEDYFIFWLENYSSVKHRKTTYTTNKDIVNSKIIPNLGKHKMINLTSDHIDQFLEEMLKIHSSSYVHGIYRVLRGALRRAHFKWGLLTENIMAGVTAPIVEKKEFDTWTLEQCQIFLENAEASPYFEVYLIAVNSGLRKSEVLGARDIDINQNRKYFEIHQTMHYKKEFGFFTQPPKTPKSKRRMPIVDNYILEMLQKKIELNKQNQDRMGDLYQTEFGMLVHCHEDGSPISPGELRYNYEKIIKESGLPYIRFHDLRHSFATNLWELGYDIKDIGELLGHSSIMVTGDIYTHMRDEKKVDVLSGFSAAMSKAKR